MAAPCHPSPGSRRSCPEPISAAAAPWQWRVPWAPSSSLLLPCGSAEDMGTTQKRLMLSAQCLSISRSVPHCDLLPTAYYRAWVVAHWAGRWAGRSFLQVSKAGGCLQGVGEDCSGLLASWLPNTRGRKGAGWAPGGPRELPACQAHRRGWGVSPTERTSPIGGIARVHGLTAALPRGLLLACREGRPGKGDAQCDPCQRAPSVIQSDPLGWGRAVDGLLRAWAEDS